MARSSRGRGQRVVLLQHGTTRQRAERIISTGPDPRFVEPGGLASDPARGFCTARIKKEYVITDPEDQARRKARLFPNEGGPAIVELEVPESIVALAIRSEHEEVRFEPGSGLEELLNAWRKLVKRMILP